MSKGLEFPRHMFFGYESTSLSADASDLGLAPGIVPEQVTVVWHDGSRVLYYRGEPVIHNGQVVACEYHSEVGIKLTINND